MTLSDLLRQPAAQAIGWALIHFIWQGALIGLLTAAALLALRRSAADVRYVVATIALSLMLTMPAVTAVQTWRAATAGAPVADVRRPDLPPSRRAPAFADASADRRSLGGGGKVGRATSKVAGAASDPGSASGRVADDGAAAPMATSGYARTTDEIAVRDKELRIADCRLRIECGLEIADWRLDD
jgi:hypothetical protein